MQELTAVAREVDTVHQKVLQELTKDLLQTGREISDNAERVGKNLGRFILNRTSVTDSDKL